MDTQNEMAKLGSGSGSKSFFARPEGKTGLLFIGAGIAAAGYGLYHLLPYLITLLENTLYAGLLGGALLVLTSPIWSTKIRTLTSYVFRSTMRKITGFFVEIDPIGILKNYIEDVRKNLSVMEKQIANLRGHIQRIKGIIAKNAEEAQHSMKIAAVAKQEQQKAALVLNSRKAGRLEKSNLTLQAMLGKMESLYKMLLKLQEVSKITADDMASEVEVKEQEHNAIRASYGAFTSAMKILRGDPNTRALYDQAMEHLADDYAAKVGEIENFMATSEGFIASVDLDNLVFEESAMKKIEELEQRADSLFATTSSVHVAEPQAVGAVSSLYR